MGALVEAEFARLKTVYSSTDNLRIDDLVELMAGILRIEEAANAKLTTINVAGPATLSAGDITGANHFVELVNTNAAPGSLTTRTAALMIADHGSALLTVLYRMRISNSGAGTLTLVAGASVTLTGTMTVATATFRDFLVTMNGVAATVTIQAIGQGTYS